MSVFEPIEPSEQSTDSFLADVVKATPRRIALSDDQEVALAKLVAWAEGAGGPPVMTLAGVAGTGKSTLMREFVRELRPGTVALTSPTNKATKVLRDMVEAEGMYEVQCLTIHAANGLRLQDDAPQKYTVKSGKSQFDRFKVIVVDEASMIGEKIGSLILEEAQNHDVKILFVGDPMQLAPVKDGGHIAFAGGIPQVRLTQIMRQALDNPIVRLGDYFRKLLAGTLRPSTPFPVSPAGTDGVHYLGEEEFWERYTSALALQSHHDDNRGVSYTNAAVDYMASRGRDRVYGDHGVWHVGERVYTTSPISSGEVGMYTDQEAVIEHVGKVGYHPSCPDFEARPLLLQLDNKANIYAFVATDDSRPYVEAELERLHKIASGMDRNSNRRGFGEAWQQYHRFHDAWADLRSVFALTAHRSQGSTFTDVFVNGRDLSTCRDQEARFRLWYVACSRARRNVFIRR